MREEKCWWTSLKAAHELTLSKVCPIFIGLVLLVSISVTVTVLLLGVKVKDVLQGCQGEECEISSRNSSIKLMVSLAIFLALTMSAVGLKMGLLAYQARAFTPDDNSIARRDKHNREVRYKAYLGGLALIPGWGWKEVMVIVTLVALGKSPPPWQAAGMVLAVAFASACIDIFLEYLGKGLPDDSFWRQCIVTTGTSFCVGVGYALNLLFKTIMTQYMGLWGYWPARAIYTVLITAFVVWAQGALDTFLKEHMRDWDPLSIKSLQFIMNSGKCLVGWAWKGFLTLVIPPLVKGTASSACLDQVIVSLVISLIMFIGAGIAISRDSYREVAMLVAGICVGWTWEQSWLACGYISDQGLGMVWLSALLVIALAGGMAVVFDLAFIRVEDFVVAHEKRFEDEERRLVEKVEEAKTIGRSMSTKALEKVEESKNKGKQFARRASSAF